MNVRNNNSGSGNYHNPESSSLNSGIGYGRDSDSQSSSTGSGINTANLIITDEAGQKELSGKTAAETIVAVKTDISTDNHAQHAGRQRNRSLRGRFRAQARYDRRRQRGTSQQ